MLCSPWENKDVVCVVSRVAWVEAVYWPPRHCPAARCWGQGQAVQALYNLCPLSAPASRIHDLKKGSEHTCDSVLFSDTLSVRRGSHTKLSLLVSFLAGVDGSTDVYMEGKALCNQAAKQQRQSHRQQWRGACHMQTLGSGWEPGNSFESLCSSSCSDQIAVYPLFSPSGTGYEIKSLAGGENTASISHVACDRRWLSPTGFLGTSFTSKLWHGAR